MFKIFTNALSKSNIVVKLGAKQAQQGKKGTAVNAFAFKGRDAKARKQKSG